MKTFEIHIVRTVLYEMVNRDKYFKFTLKSERGKPYRCKGKIGTAWATPRGMVIDFSKLFINKKYYITRLSFALKDIRWIDNPFTKEFQDKCEDLQIKEDILKEDFKNDFIIY